MAEGRDIFGAPLPLSPEVTGMATRGDSWILFTHVKLKLGLAPNRKVCYASERKILRNLGPPSEQGWAGRGGWSREGDHVRSFATIAPSREGHRDLLVDTTGLRKIRGRVNRGRGMFL